jgi:hypothetical protein
MCGSLYNFGDNQIQDMLMQVLIHGDDISSKKLKQDINDVISEYLIHFLENEKDVIYLDFDIKKNKSHFKVIGNNFISALWLSNLIPSNSRLVLDNNELIVDNTKYTFNQKTKVLIVEQIKKRKNGEK